VKSFVHVQTMPEHENKKQCFS